MIIKADVADATHTLGREEAGDDQEEATEDGGGEHNQARVAEGRAGCEKGESGSDEDEAEEMVPTCATATCRHSSIAGKGEAPPQ